MISRTSRSALVIFESLALNSLQDGTMRPVKREEGRLKPLSRPIHQYGQQLPGHRLGGRHCRFLRCSRRRDPVNHINAVDVVVADNQPFIRPEVV